MRFDRTGTGDHTRARHHDQTEPRRPRRTRRVAALAAALITAVTTTAAIAPTANAGVMQYGTCNNSNQTTSASGWRGESIGSAPAGTSFGTLTNTCGASGGVLAATVGTDAVTMGNVGIAWTFTAPAGTRITAVNLSMYSYSTWSGPSAYLVRAWKDGSNTAPNVIWGPVPDPDRPHHYQGYFTQSNLDWQSMTWAIQCTHVFGSHCDQAPWQQWMLYGGLIDLTDNNAPNVSSVSGSLPTSGTTSGTKTVSYNVTDQGVGAYQTLVYVDGDLKHSQIINSNGGKCQPLVAGQYRFGHHVPCPLSTSDTVSINTRDMSDGEHAIRVLTVDAAGNRTVVIDRDLTIDNYWEPQNTAAPTISTATARVGATFTSTNGSWSASPAADFSYQWFRCPSGVTSGNAISDCAAIVGAAGSSHIVGEADAYARLILRVRASNSIGASVAYSNVSSIVADEDGSTTSTLPVLVTPPQVSGSARVGSRVTTSTGAWRSSAIVASYEYQWRVGGQAVAGATGSSFVPTLDQAYKQLSVVVTARNRNGATSATVEIGTIADAAGRTEAPRDESREGEQERPPGGTPPGGEQPPTGGGGQPPAPSVGQLNGTNAGPRATVTAAFAKGRKRAVVAAGKGAKITGRVVNSSTRRPIGNAVITMVTTAPGRRAVSKTIKTSAAGTFAAKLPRTATSGTIAFRYTERVGGATAASTAAAGEAKVTLSVRSKLSWKATSAKRVLKFTGSISTPVPAKGKQFVEVQWKRGKTWATLAHPVAVNKKGKWTLKYAVGSNVATGQRFQFRAAIRTSASGYPFAASSTKAKWVRVK